MKVLKQTDDYTVYQKRSGRYAVVGSDKKNINGEDKVKILVAEGIVKQAVAAPEPEVVEEAVEEAVVEETVAEEAPAEEAPAEEAPAVEEAVAEEPAAEEAATEEAPAEAESETKE